MMWGGALAGLRPSRRLLPTPPLHTVVYAHLAVLGAVWLGRLATGSLPW
jgi:hypothetical protein